MRRLFLLLLLFAAYSAQAVDPFYIEFLEPPSTWVDGHLPRLHRVTRPPMAVLHIHPSHDIQLAQHRDLFHKTLLDARLNRPLNAADLYLIRDYYKDQIGTGVSWGSGLVGGFIGGTVVGNAVLLAITLPTLGFGLTFGMPLKMALGFGGSQIAKQIGKAVGRHVGSKLSKKAAHKHKQGFYNSKKGRQQAYFETQQLTGALTLPLKIIYLDAGVSLDNALSALFTPLSWPRGVGVGRLTHSLIKHPLKSVQKKERRALLEKNKTFDVFLHDNARRFQNGEPLENWH